MLIDGINAVGQEGTIIEPSAGVPRGPEGSIKLTYLEINTWVCQVNGLNILVDPLFGTLDFGVPALIRANKRVIRDGSRALREIAPVTDCLAITQGFDDHCHPGTIEAISGLLDPSVRIIAPPSAAEVLERHFPPSRITYLLPGETTVVSKGGRAVSLLATAGALLGPPWQQRENGYLIRSAAASPGAQAPAGGSLYLEPHLMFDKAELSGLHADVVIAPVVSQMIGPFTLVAGGAKAVDLTSTLKASKLVVMSNAEADYVGPLGDVVQSGNTLDSFLELARERGLEVIIPTPTNAWPVWP